MKFLTANMIPAHPWLLSKALFASIRRLLLYQKTSKTYILISR